MYFKNITDGGLGAKLPAAGRYFVIFLNQKAVLTPLDHVSHVFGVIQKPIEKIKSFSPFFACYLTPKHV